MVWPEEFVLPDYAGGAIANIPATVAALLGAPFEGLPPLRPALWQSLAERPVRRVVLFVVDGLGWNVLQKERARWTPWLERATVMGRLTSVFPSTTVNALSSLWTGVGPAQHGLVGLSLLFPDMGVVGQMLSMTPDFYHAPGALVAAGLEPERFLAAPGLAQQLAAGGVRTHTWKAQAIVHSALSQMHDRGAVKSHGAVSPADMLVQIRQLLEAHPRQSLYVYAYWASVDTLSHAAGWDSPAVAAEAHNLLHLFQTLLLDGLSPAGRRGTVAILVADHGQTRWTPATYVRTGDHERLRQLLLLRNTGEPRVPYFYARQGRTTDLLAYIQTELPEQAISLTAEQALAMGLLGPAPYAEATRERLGDVIMPMRRHAIYLNPRDPEYIHRFVGGHGSLTADEMEVPWLAFRLD